MTTAPRVNGCAYGKHDQCDGIRYIVIWTSWPSFERPIGNCGCECHSEGGAEQ